MEHVTNNQELDHSKNIEDNEIDIKEGIHDSDGLHYGDLENPLVIKQTVRNPIPAIENDSLESHDVEFINLFPEVIIDTNVKEECVWVEGIDTVENNGNTQELGHSVDSLIIYDNENITNSISKTTNQDKLSIFPQEQSINSKFPCIVCSMSYNSLDELKVHFQIHFNDNLYQCNVCGKKLQNKSALSNHLRVHLERSISCSQCNKKFRHTKDLDIHFRVHIRKSQEKSGLLKYIINATNNENTHKMEQSAVDNCLNDANIFISKNNTNVVYKDDLTYSDEQSMGTKLNCNMCSLPFNSIEELKMHLNIHFNEHSFECNDCGKKLLNKSALSNHMKVHMERLISCSQCDRKFLHKKDLNMHSKVHTSESLEVESLISTIKVNSDKRKQRVESNFIDVNDFIVQNITNVTDQNELSSSNEQSFNSTFKCNICSLPYNSIEELKVHLQIHFNKNLYQCDVCNKILLNKSALSNHMKVHMERFISCSQCDKKFLHIKDLSMHSKVHTVECLEVKDNHDITENTQKVEKSMDSNFIDVNQYITKENSQNELLTYPHEQGNNNKFNCSICSLPYNSIKELNVHLDVHLNESLFPCNVCDKKMKNKIALSNHMRVHLERLVSCGECDKKFRTEKDLARHSRIHTGEKLFQCTICKQKFPDKTVLNCHAKTHPDDSFHCNICSKSFSRKKKLIDHLRQHIDEPFEGGDDKKQCLNANVKRYSRTSLYGNRQSKCEVCLKHFYDKSTLNCHSRVHTGIKPYQCHICSKNFTQKVSLKCHLRLHMEDKPYECNVCKKKFYDSSNLKRHLKKHTGEKAFQCNICSKKFTVKASLRNHINKHSVME